MLFKEFATLQKKPCRNFSDSDVDNGCNRPIYQGVGNFLLLSRLVCYIRCLRRILKNSDMAFFAVQDHCHEIDQAAPSSWKEQPEYEEQCYNFLSRYPLDSGCGVPSVLSSVLLVILHPLAAWGMHSRPWSSFWTPQRVLCAGPPFIPHQAWSMR
jgi:hypothetical protein